MANMDKIMARLKKAFDELDTDGDGQITAKDLKICLEKAGLNPTDDELKKLIAISDKTGSGSVGFEEFAEAMLELGVNFRCAMVMRRAFRAMDTFGAGKTLNFASIRQVLDVNGIGEVVSDDEIKEFIKAADKKGDGEITKAEFMAELERAANA